MSPFPLDHRWQVTDDEGLAHPPDVLAEIEADGQTVRAIQQWLATLDHPDHGLRFLKKILESSPYLRGLICRYSDTLVDVLGTGPVVALDKVLAPLAVNPDPLARPPQPEVLMRQLRTVKGRAALVLALTELAAVQPLLWITEGLSRVAARTLCHALDCALKTCLRRSLPERADDWTLPIDRCGVVALAMGKLGAGELNFSSDIDLILLFDPERIKSRAPDHLQSELNRAVRLLTRIMEERTSDGYVFRVDLRLRPDHGATPPIIALEAAWTYYESLAQTWERAAMIKAHPIAGDYELGHCFLSHIQPFIWRKYLDFSAILDIQRIHSQIEQSHRTQAGQLAGRNIKLGAGGIRAIEFFVQTLQLIWGGRRVSLRQSRTLDILSLLVSEQLIDSESAKVLSQAYLFLRGLEHCLQMIEDQQTQTLPNSPEGLQPIRKLMGRVDDRNFEDEILSHLQGVTSACAELYAHLDQVNSGAKEPVSQASLSPSVSYTSDQLRRFGFSEPDFVHARIQIWLSGRVRCLGLERSRRLLLDLLDPLLQHLGATGDADEAFRRFDDFLTRLPAGMQLFSLFRANPSLLHLVTTLLGNAPRLAEELARDPSRLDCVLEPGFHDPFPGTEHLQEALDHLIEASPDASFAPVQSDPELALSLIRRFSAERAFQLGVRLLTGIDKPEAANQGYSRLADAALSKLVPLVQSHFSAQYGTIAGSFALLGLGKLGGHELLPASDIDMMFLYDSAEDGALSSGPKAIGTEVYYLRFCQRLVGAITANSRDGRLYEVDLRLRPGGTAGPLATKLQALESYFQLEDGVPAAGKAWTFEHMALTRARVILASSSVIHQQIEQLIRVILCQPRDPARLRDDVLSMRIRIFREKPPANSWDIKYLEGGLIDAEFIVQYLLLKHASRIEGLIDPDTAIALGRLRSADIISQERHDRLLTGLRLWRRLQGVLRLTSKGMFDEATAPKGQCQAIAQACGFSDFMDLKNEISLLRKNIHLDYQEIVAA